MIRSLYIFVIFFSSVIQVYAQRSDQFRFEDVSKNITFSHNEITAIAQDKQGFIWVGTRSGLNRFDGQKVKMYLHEPENPYSLSSNWIENIYCDTSGYILITTRRYLNIFNPKTEQFFHIKHQVPSKCDYTEPSTGNMYKESDTVLWFTTAAGLYRLSSKTCIPERMPLPPEYEYKGWHCCMVDLLDDKRGNLWITCRMGIYCFNKKNRTFTLYPSSVVITKPWEQSILSYLEMDESGKIWATSWNIGLVCFDTTLKKYTAYKKFESDNAGYGGYELLIEKDRIISTSVEGGLTVMDRKTGKFYNYLPNDKDPISISSTITQAIFKDKDNNYWVGTDNGLNKVNKFNSMMYYKPLLDTTQEYYLYWPHTMVEADSTHLLLGAYGGLFSWRKKDGKLTYLSDQLNMPYKAGCFEIQKSPNDDSILVSITNKIFKIKFENEKIKGYRIIHENPYIWNSNFVFDNNGNLWCSSQNGLVFHDIKKNTYEYFGKNTNGKFTLKNDFIGSLFYDKRHNKVWIGPEHHGLLRIDPETFEAKEYSTETRSDYLDDINISMNAYGDDYLLLGTEKVGIVIYDVKEDKFTRAKFPDWYLNTTIYQMTFDRKGRLLITADGGLGIFNTKNGHFQSLGKSNGLLRDKLSTDFYYDGEKHVYIPEEGGKMHILNLDEVQRNNISPKPIVLSTKVSGEEYKLPDDHHISLPFSKNSLEFEFATLNYVNSQLNSFQYKMEGRDDNWIDLKGSRTINFSNLGPGKYSLLVRAINNDGIVSDGYETIYIHIHPPFYLTWWFITLFVCLILGVIYIIYRIRLAKLLEVQAIRNRISRDLHDDVGSTLSGISMYSKMAKDLAGQDDEKSLELLDSIGEKSRNTLNNMSDIVWSVNPENDSMERIIARMKGFASEHFDAGNISFEFIADNIPLDVKLSLEVKRNLFLLFKEAVNNAVKYSQTEHAQIMMELKGKFLKIEIKDNGVGFDVVKLKRINGLDNMKKRAEECGGSCVIISEPGKGTVIRARFPIT